MSSIKPFRALLTDVLQTSTLKNIKILDDGEFITGELPALPDPVNAMSFTMNIVSDDLLRCRTTWQQPVPDSSLQNTSLLLHFINQHLQDGWIVLDFETRRITFTSTISQMEFCKAPQQGVQWLLNHGLIILQNVCMPLLAVIYGKISLRKSEKWMFKLISEASNANADAADDEPQMPSHYAVAIPKRPSPTEHIERLLIANMKRYNLKYEQHSGKPFALSCGLGSLTCQFDRISLDIFAKSNKAICYSSLPLRSKKRQLNDVAQFLHHVNGEQSRGFFELEPADGSIRFKTTVSLSSLKRGPNAFLTFIRTGADVVEHYGDPLLNVLMNKQSSAEAITHVKSASEW